MRFFAVYLDPFMGRTPTPIWTTVPQQAKRLRQRIRMILQWCVAHGFVEQNVCGEVLDGALPSMPVVKEHRRSLPYQDRSPRPPTYRLLRGNLTVQAVFTLPDLDGSTARGSPQRGVVRDRLRQQSLDHPAKKNESERGTSGAVIRCRTQDTGTGQGGVRFLHLHFSVAGTKRSALNCADPVPRPGTSGSSRPSGRAWIQEHV